nr:TM2 domain-containing protein [uncultured Carboxylicivirga sp.]
MDSNSITLFLAQNADRFPAESMPVIKKKLEEIDDQRFFLISTQEYRNPTIMLVLSFFFGYLGVDRFMLGQTGLGIAKLLTCGGFGIWTLVDLFLIMGATKDSNFEKFTRVA